MQAGVVLNSVTERFLFGWRISLAVPVLVGSVLALGALLLPETPRHEISFSLSLSLSRFSPPLVLSPLIII